MATDVAEACRRQIQLQSVGALGARQALQKVLERDGVPGLYRGFLPNALKNLPNKGQLRLLLMHSSSSSSIAFRPSRKVCVALVSMHSSGQTCNRGSSLSVLKNLANTGEQACFCCSHKLCMKLWRKVLSVVCLVKGSTKLSTR